jgi:molybdopterin converting factor small subunit
MIRVAIPAHLRSIARTDAIVEVEVRGEVTPNTILDALEAKYPMLRGTIREHGTLKRRSYLRFFACKEDWSHESQDAVLPEAVAAGHEPFIVMGAVAGG